MQSSQKRGRHGILQKGGPEATESPNIHPWLYTYNFKNSLAALDLASVHYPLDSVLGVSF